MIMFLPAKIYIERHYYNLHYISILRQYLQKILYNLFIFYILLGVPLSMVSASANCSEAQFDTVCCFVCIPISVTLYRQLSLLGTAKAIVSNFTFLYYRTI